MRSARLALIVVAASLSLVPAASPAPGAPARLVPSPAYYRPEVAGGFTFPVARSNWLSVIQFDEDWHEPRFRLIGGRWQLVGVHEGNDILAEEGTPVLSATAGTVEAVGWTFYSGTRVGVRGTDGKYYFYAHLSAVAPGLGVGTPVDPGSLLGRVGNTGYGNPGTEDRFLPHLHFGVEGPRGWENPYPAVRKAYEHSVRATSEGERRLSALAEAGRAAAWRHVADTLYAPWPTALGRLPGPVGGN
jgi:murein DD-endopeptidase MepM/ murein hydrolase activator NlpD